MDEVRAKIAAIVWKACRQCEAVMLDEEAHEAADEIMALFAETPCEICGKPAEVVRCESCDHYANMER